MWGPDKLQNTSKERALEHGWLSGLDISQGHPHAELEGGRVGCVHGLGDFIPHL